MGRTLPPEHEQAGREFPVPGEEIACFELTGDYSLDLHMVVGLDPGGDPVVDCGGVPVAIEPLMWRWPYPGEVVPRFDYGIKGES